MSSCPETDHGQRRSERTAPDVLPMLLDRRQWSYVCRRYELTPRELEIAERVCRGFRNHRIAQDLKIRPETVKTHVRNIYRKVKVSSKIAMLLRFIDDVSGVERLGGQPSPFDPSNRPNRMSRPQG
jgi:DNA-binding NarL/FixJ family response regulator